MLGEWARGSLVSKPKYTNSPTYPVWKTSAVPRFTVLYALWGSQAAPTSPNQAFNTSRLASPKYLPKQFEYIARDQFDCIDQAGRGIIKLIEIVGMSNLGALWNFKLKFLGWWSELVGTYRGSARHLKVFELPWGFWGKMTGTHRVANGRNNSPNDAAVCSR